MKDQAKILLVEDEAPSREALLLLLKSGGIVARGCATGEEALRLVESERFDIVITDLMLPDISGIDILKKIKDKSPATEVILVTGYASAETAVKAMKEGAYDYITKPLNIDELRIIIDKALEKTSLVNENVYLKKQLREKFEFSNIIGSSQAMQKVFALIKRIIKTDSTVLILGESGTGKEVVAKAIHFNSQRKDKPFITVHCGAIPGTLLESELFGYTRGSFTGATRDKMGKFESANHGTIFLDEIGTMPLELQTKLLRVLQEHEVEKIGSSKTVKIDVRVISATNMSLEEEVKKGNFREDLYYRLNVIPINIPPLRERIEDILPLAKHFLTKYCTVMGRQIMPLSREALEAMEAYDWPGNVRELENVIERTVALSESDRINVDDLPSTVVLAKNIITDHGIDLVKMTSDIEQIMIREALSLARGVKARAASLLNVNRTTLVEKMKRLGIDGND
jgi:DNA-binding NtrC family response regulator